MPQEAERVLLEEALPRDPSLWVAHFNLGLVYLRADRPACCNRWRGNCSR